MGACALLFWLFEWLPRPRTTWVKTPPVLNTKGEIMKKLYVELVLMAAFLMTYVVPVLADGGGGM